MAEEIIVSGQSAVQCMGWKRECEYKYPRWNGMVRSTVFLRTCGNEVVGEHAGRVLIDGAKERVVLCQSITREGAVRVVVPL